MDDPVEVLFSLINLFHSYSIGLKELKYVVDKPCEPQCTAHSLFWINIFEQYVKYYI
jgi:hypothetical protein